MVHELQNTGARGAYDVADPELSSPADAGTGARVLPAAADCGTTALPCPLPTRLPLLATPAGLRRVRIKVALNVGVNDLLMVLTSDAELPWLESAINRAALVPVGVAE